MCFNRDSGSIQAGPEAGMISESLADETEQTFEAAGLPVKAPVWNPRRIFEEMLHDKSKRRKAEIRTARTDRRSNSAHGG